jgi:hypothetical protein
MFRVTMIHSNKSCAWFIYYLGNFILKYFPFTHDSQNDALPTPQRAQMWAQVRKQRKKEKSEHAP